MKFASIILLVAIVCTIAFYLFSSSRCDHNTLTDKEKSEGWISMFDGKTTMGWHLFNKGSTASAWLADSGMLICNPRAKNVKHGDLITNTEYENYDLRFEWKISKAGNSGVFINVQENPQFGSTFSTGPEYQLLDDKNIDAEYQKDLTHKAASIFGVIPNTSSSVPKPGEWNESRILQKDGKVTFWLNGVKTIQIDFKSDEWKKSVAVSSMSKFASFGVTSKGHIALQDWTSGVSFRDIKIKQL